MYFGYLPPAQRPVKIDPQRCPRLGSFLFHQQQRWHKEKGSENAMKNEKKIIKVLFENLRKA
jgi:hypothetical protein